MKNLMKVAVAILLIASMTGIIFAESISEKVEKTMNNNPTIESVKALGYDMTRYVVLKFKDVKESEWYMAYVSKLVGLGGIKGYDDGTFKPNGIITHAEFVTMLSSSVGIKARDLKGDHWAAGIFDGAKAAGVVKEGEYPESVWNKPITRYDMARLSVRAVQFKKETVPAEFTQYLSILKDTANMTPSYKEDVLKVVSMGIISGYTDKTFQGTRTLTRAEASIVVIKVIDPTERKIPSLAGSIASLSGSIAMGETKPFAEILPEAGKIYSNKGYGYEYSTITLVPSEPYKLNVQMGQDKVTPYIEAQGNPGAFLLISDNKVIYREDGTWHQGEGITYYLAGDLYQKAEYIGFAHADEANMKLIVNPFRKE